MTEPLNVINFDKVAKEVTQLYRYEIISRVNDHSFTVVRVKDRTLEFHSHPDSDEAFIVLEGRMKLEFRDKTIEMAAGEMCVVPKGTEHRPICTSEVLCMLVEKADNLTNYLNSSKYKPDSKR